MRTLVTIAMLLAGCRTPEHAAGADPEDTYVDTVPDSGTDSFEGPGNILILLIDDVGTDKYRPYGTHEMQPSTPNLDGLAERGVLFRNAYATPICSPTRASLLTGRYPSRVGVGRTIWELSDVQLHQTQTLLPEMLAESPHDFATAAIGKWHLAGVDSDAPLDHPNNQGFDSYLGTLGNISNYYSWALNDNGTVIQTEVYATTHQIDTAIQLIDTLPEPWLIYLAFNAPHSPLHVPPTELHGFPDLDLDDGDPTVFAAVVEAVDAEVGRLFSHMDGPLMDRTTVMFMGDNGTPYFAISDPFDSTRAKDTVFEGGVNVPFVVAGPHVAQPGTESDAFVHVVDVFHTVAEIAEVDVVAGALAGVPTDGVSVVPYLTDPSTPSIREYAFTEEFVPLGGPPYTARSQMTRDARYKVIRIEKEDEPTREELFEFVPGAVDEGPVIPQPYDAEQQDAYDRLVAEMDRLDADLVYDPRD